MRSCHQAEEWHTHYFVLTSVSTITSANGETDSKPYSTPTSTRRFTSLPPRDFHFRQVGTFNYSQFKKCLVSKRLTTLTKDPAIFMIQLTA